MTAPLRFGVSTNTATSASELKDRARRLEDLGYYSMLFQDHYLGPGPAVSAAKHPPQNIAAIPAVAVAAAATSTLVVGFRVLCIDYHQPVVLAKQLATLDLLSDGRLEVGLGAGWMAAEYAAMGVPLDSPAVRIARLGETIEFLDQFFEGSLVDYTGSYVTASGFEGTPARKRPPVAIGGGSRRILSLAARHADIVSINLNMRTGVFGAEAIRSGDAMDEKLRWIRAVARERTGDLVIEVGAHFVVITPDAADADGALERMTRVPADLARQHPHALAGSVDQICELIEERRERYGISYLTVQERVAESFAPVVARLAGR